MTLSMAPSSRTAAPLDEPARVRAALVRAPLFASLPPVAIDDLTQRVTVKRVAAHGTVVSQDEPGDAMFVIMSGRVKVVIFGENGREVTLSILRPGDAFGVMSLFDGKLRSANCIAMEPTALLALSRDDLLRHMAAHPRTALNLLGEMADRLRRADESRAPRARGPIDSSARRSRSAISPSRLSAVRGWAAMCRSRSSRERTSSAVGSIAMQLAERALPSNKDISPKPSPGRRMERVTSRPFSPKRTTFTRPLMMMNIASPGSSCDTTVPWAETRRTAMRWVRSSTAAGGSEVKSGAFAMVARMRAGSSIGAAVRAVGAMLSVIERSLLRGGWGSLRAGGS